jgi:argininosuccinate synthase
MTRIVVGYSGGLETTTAIARLRERFSADVIAVTVDLGQDRDLVDLRERALAAGAVRAHVLDARDEFAREYILPALQAGASDARDDSLAKALAHPLIAAKLVDIARIEGANVIAHGAIDADDQARIEASACSLQPRIEVLAPARESNMTGDRATERCAHSNLWGRESTDSVYTLTRAPEHCPDEAAYIDIDFESGVPVRANGIDMPFVELIESVETIAGAHGVGRIDSVNGRASAAARVIREAPAALVLQTAQRELEAVVVRPALARLKQDLARAYTDLVYDGLWFSPARHAIDAFVRIVQRRVTGSVRLALSKGECTVVDARFEFATEAR